MYDEIDHSEHDVSDDDEWCETCGFDPRPWQDYTVTLNVPVRARDEYEARERAERAIDIGCEAIKDNEDE